MNEHKNNGWINQTIYRRQEIMFYLIIKPIVLYKLTEVCSLSFKPL